jgi:CheY-like chemotaxis protein
MRSLRATILVVEDDGLFREWVAMSLRDEGYEVIPLCHGQEAMDYLEGNAAPDLILLDMLMPVLDGWRFLKELRQKSLQPPIPVVITTGTILTREWAASHGCVGFLRKPIETEDLLSEVRCCLG